MRYNKTRIIQAGKELLTAYVDVKKGNDKKAFAAFKAAMADKNIDVLMEGVAVAVAELEEDAMPELEEEIDEVEDMDMEAAYGEDEEDDEDSMEEEDLSDMESDEDSIEVTETVAKVLNLKY